MSAMIELLRIRRSIRKFTADKIAAETIELLVEALLRAPSSRGINPWEFVLVDDQKLLARLSESKEHGSEFLKNAPLGIVVCADSTKSDMWIEDCSIASIIVQMTALSLGLGSCWIQIRKRAHDSSSSAEEYIQGVLGLPEHIKVQSIIAVGHPGETKSPIPPGKLQHAKVRRNHWS
jgi:nitroreductase